MGSCVKKLKVANVKFGKQILSGGIIRWIATFPVNLALIDLLVSEKLSFMDDDDNNGHRAMTGVKSLKRQKCFGEMVAPKLYSHTILLFIHLVDGF